MFGALEVIIRLCVLITLFVQGQSFSSDGRNPFASRSRGHYVRTTPWIEVYTPINLNGVRITCGVCDQQPSIMRIIAGRVEAYCGYHRLFSR